MNAVLVGRFDTQADARAAQRRLLAAGFPAGALQMTGDSTSAASEATAEDHEGAVVRFFENLFSADGSDDVVDHHARGDAFERGSFWLAVRAASEAEMDEAGRILNAAGAIDVDERSDESRKGDRTGASVNADAAIGRH